MSRIRLRIDFDRLDVGRKRLADLDRLARLVAGAGRDAGGDLDFRTGILDRPDQAGGGLGGFAHRNRRLLGGGGDFAGLAEHPARRSGGGPGAVGERLGLVGAGADQLGDPALELLALAAAGVGGLDRLEQRNLRERDVGLDHLDAMEGGHALGEHRRIFRETLADLGDHATAEPGVLDHVDRHRRLFGIDCATVSGEELNPGGVDLAGIDRRIAIGAFLAEFLEDFADHEVGGVLAKKRDVAIQRTVPIIGGKARVDLLLGQLLQLSCLATHLSGLRLRVSCGWDALAAQWLRPG